MLKYNISNYGYDLLTSHEWKDYIGNTKMCGIVTNSDNTDFGIPILVDVDSFSLPVLPHPHLMCKSTKDLFTKKDHKICPWIIKCDINDIIELLKGNENYIVALYHEIGHFHYSDEQNQSSTDEYREEQLRKGNVSKEEIQADGFVATILGKEKVIKSLSATIAPLMMNPTIMSNPKAQSFIKEIQLRINELKK